MQWQYGLLAAGILGAASASAAGPARPATTTAPATLPAVTRPATPVKLIVPHALLIERGASAVDEVFGADIKAADTPEKKTTLARKLIDAAAEERDANNRYALLIRGRDLAIEAGDVTTAAAAIDVLDAGYQVDGLKLRTEMVTATQKVARSPERRKAIVSYAGDELVAEAIKAERYDAARTMAELALTTARLVNDQNLQREAGAKLSQVREVESAWQELRPALATLTERPEDPEANLKVGRFHCLVRGDWDKGLPLLAKGSDAALRDAAKLDLAGAATLDRQVAAGDAWWVAAENANGATQWRLRQRAGTFYEQALGSLTGLAKTRVEKRLATIEADNVKFSGNTGGRTIDLLEKLDIAKATVAGKWTLKDGVLQSDLLGGSRIELPYKPPEEYDVRVDFERVEGNESFIAILVAAGRQFTYVMGGYGNAVQGFDMVDGANVDKNKTTLRERGVLQNGKRYTFVAKVRRGGTEIILNGKPVQKFITDYSNVGIDPRVKLREKNVLGLASWTSVVKVHKVQVTEVTGTGTLLKR